MFVLLVANKSVFNNRLKKNKISELLFYLSEL